MAGTGAGYDLMPTTYSPDGRIYQLEYAQKAIDNAPTTLAMICKDGILFASDKPKLSPMLVYGTNRKLYGISKNTGCALCGVIPDGRDLVNRAREEASNYKSNYGEEIPAHLLAERVGRYSHHYTIYSGLRPFGAGILIGKVDKAGVSALFSVDAQGLVEKYKARAIGKGRQLANTEIERLSLDTLTCEEALFNAAKILQKVHEGEKAFEIEMNWIRADSGYVHEVVPKEMVEAAHERAKKALEDDEEEN